MFKLFSLLVFGMAMMISLAGCQSSGIEDELGEDDLFLLIEEGEDSYSAAIFNAFTYGRYNDIRGRGLYRRHVLKLKEADPTMQAILGISIRDPQRDEETEKECSTSLVLSSNYQLKV